MIHIDIRSIPHDKHRYDTLGDWYPVAPEGALAIRVSNMADDRHMLLIAVHELVEAILCERRGITAAVVDEFDDACIRKGLEGEPGDRVNAPYYHEHQFATCIERLLAREMGVDWNDYIDACDEFEVQHENSSSR